MSLEGVQLGNYKLMNRIGDGGMGEVYLAEDVRITRQVAIKVMKAELAANPHEEAIKAAQRLFQREMRAIANLNNAHILPMYDFGTQSINKSELTYMVMPYCNEGSLADWLQQRGTSGPLSLTDVAHIIDQAAEALQYAHDNDLLHQDIKPQNFLVRSRKDAPNRPDLFLADFGIAKFTSATSTVGQSVRGTPGYMPPEQWSSSPGPASDQYALAMMTYELLTRRLPFQGRMEQVMYQHLQVQPPAPSTFDSRISLAIDAVILRALAKKPEDRFPSISAFARAFQQATGYTDLHSTLVLTRQEALVGINRAMKLPGIHQLTIIVPPGAYRGQILRIEGEGEPYYENGPRGLLILTILIEEKEKQSPPIPISPFRLTNNFLNKRNFIFFLLLLIIALTSISGITIYQTHAHISGDSSFGQIHAHELGVDAYPSYFKQGKGTIALTDPLTKPSQWGVDTSSFTNASCKYDGEYFHVKISPGPKKDQNQKNSYYICNSDRDNFNNFAIEVQMTITSGDCGGITFRYSSAGQFYMFIICKGPPQCKDSSFYLLNYTNPQGNKSVSLTDAGGICVSLKPTNVLAVIALSNNFYLYINSEQVGSASDGSYSHGKIGFLAETNNNTDDVAYSNARIWTVS